MIVTAPSLFLILGVAVLTGAATALRSVSRIWLRHWAERRLAGAGTATLYLDRPQRLILAAGTGIAGLTFAAGALLGVQAARAPVGMTRQLLVLAVLLLVFGQLVPRAVARRWPAELLPFLLPPLRIVESLTGPISLLAIRVVRQLRGGLLPTSPDAQESLDDLLREGELEGVGGAGERAIISGVVEFGTKRVAMVMTPRSEIVAIDRRTPAPEIARIVAQSKYSRLPIYDGTLDTVVGVLTSWDVIADPADPLSTPRQVTFASPDEPCQSLMTRMLRERRHLAIVRGPQLETLGLVTLEDLVEEFVGEIRDEHDDPHPES